MSDKVQSFEGLARAMAACIGVPVPPAKKSRALCGDEVLNELHDTAWRLHPDAKGAVIRAADLLTEARARVESAEAERDEALATLNGARASVADLLAEEEKIRAAVADVEADRAAALADRDGALAKIVGHERTIKELREIIDGGRRANVEQRAHIDWLGRRLQEAERVLDEIAGQHCEADGPIPPGVVLEKRCPVCLARGHANRPAGAARCCPCCGEGLTDENLKVCRVCGGGYHVGCTVSHKCCGAETKP